MQRATNPNIAELLKHILLEMQKNAQKQEFKFEQKVLQVTKQFQQIQVKLEDAYVQIWAFKNKEKLNMTDGEKY